MWRWERRAPFLEHKAQGGPRRYLVWQRPPAPNPRTGGYVASLVKRTWQVRLRWVSCNGRLSQGIQVGPVYTLGPGQREAGGQRQASLGDAALLDLDSEAWPPMLAGEAGLHGASGGHSLAAHGAQ